MCEILWNSSGETPQKIAFKTLLLELAAARAALSQVDLAASGLVQPASTASQTVSSIEYKNALIQTFQKAVSIKKMVEHSNIETGPSQYRVKDRIKVFKPQRVHPLWYQLKVQIV